MIRSCSISRRRASAQAICRLSCLYILTVLTFLACIAASAETDISRDRFFSYGRFVLNKDFIDSMPAEGKVQDVLNSFMVRFKDALSAISDGQLERAKKDLLNARKTWPEYFGVDFLLARIYEDQGDYGTAARYYKSYLNKLKDLHENRYRISGPLIRSLTPYGVEEYDLARELVKERLDNYGISLDGVFPVFTPPDFLLPSLLGIAAGGVYVLVYYWIWPYIRRKRRINNPPEGFWICRYCDTANPKLCRECERCGRLRE
jgi:tetratricopeptide (TPR) repeat protein